MKSKQKIIPFDRLAEWRNEIQKAGKKLVVTNGCFDLLHAGHVHYLETAREHGDLLLVGINNDTGVRQLKGKDRPLNTEMNRALVLSGLGSVDAVCIFDGHRATAFLEMAIPNIYVKGGDYTIETLDARERAVVERAGADIVLIPFEHDVSTTGIIGKMKG